jgi:hypothetical protein
MLKQFLNNLKFRLKYKPHPNWRPLLKKNASLWRTRHAEAKKGLKVLIATSTGAYSWSTIVESMLAAALTLRSAAVNILLCDGALPACQQCMVGKNGTFEAPEEFVTRSVSNICKKYCFPTAYKMFRALGLPIHRYSDFITSKERKTAQRLSQDIPFNEIKNYRLNGLAVGEHAFAGALRFFARGDLDGEPFGEIILRRYLNAALLTTFMAQQLLEANSFNCACFHHGIYVPQGLIGEVMRHQNVRVVNWDPTYRRHCFIFSHNDTYHHTMMTEPTANWENMPWSEKNEQELLKYLKSRWQGTQDWIWFFENPTEELSDIIAELKIDQSHPCIGLLTNVVWDAEVHYSARVFPNTIEWILETIRYFIKRPELQLIIRIHPAELIGNVPSRQPVLAEIKKAFTTLPKNIIIIPPDRQISTYAVMLICNSVLIYSTKMAVELTSRGIPAIVAGEAWIRNKGITKDAHTKDEYFQLLDELPLKERLSEAMIKRARKYAYHFFFRRMIPLSFIKPVSASSRSYQLQISSVAELLPGKHPGLDVICDGILKQAEFIYPAELL